mmetsp:Transcript_33596/g.93616  ORF Transcript_33596/g.93616 Transcript_33596/m.93616 type:complete len:251 (+) Transcript_33596:170-922(+)
MACRRSRRRGRPTRGTGGATRREVGTARVGTRRLCGRCWVGTMWRKATARQRSTARSTSSACGGSRRRPRAHTAPRFRRAVTWTRARAAAWREAARSWFARGASRPGPRRRGPAWHWAVAEPSAWWTTSRGSWSASRRRTRPGSHRAGTLTPAWGASSRTAAPCCPAPTAAPSRAAGAPPPSPSLGARRRRPSTTRTASSSASAWPTGQGSPTARTRSPVRVACWRAIPPSFVAPSALAARPGRSRRRTS